LILALAAGDTYAAIKRSLQHDCTNDFALEVVANGAL
jgi:hypothetical protein